MKWTGKRVVYRLPHGFEDAVKNDKASTKVKALSFLSVWSRRLNFF